MSDSLLGLSGRTAIVTGGGRGGGRGIATLLARAGMNVAVADLDAEAAEAAAAELRALGVSACGVAADVRDPEAARAIVSRAQSALGPIRLGVNNVGNFGSAAPTPVLDQSWDVWQMAVDLNLRTTLQSSQAFARAMIDHGDGGSIINIASLSGLHGSPNLAQYGAVKAGVMHLTETLALELAPHKIRVNCVAPTAIDSPSLREALSDEAIEGIRRSIPLARICTPRDVGGAVLLLASELAGFVTGQTLMCDGGVSATTMRPSMAALEKP